MSEQNITKKTAAKERFLSWTAVIYPDSMPENWRGILGELMISWAISPLHDKDINADGTPKKPHYHLLVSFRSVKTYEQAKEITDRFNGTIPQPCRDTRGLVRYFLHLDNPEKAQYERASIQAGGGFDVENALKPTATEEEDILDEMCEFIEANWITEFCDFNIYVRRNRPEWRCILRKNSYYFGQIIKSRRHSASHRYPNTPTPPPQGVAPEGGAGVLLPDNLPDYSVDVQVLPPLGE